MFLTTPSVGLAGSNRAWTQQRREVPLCCLYRGVCTYTGELLDEYFTFLFSKACQQKYLNATQTKDKLSSGTKKLVEKRMNRKYVQCRNGGKVFFVKETKFDFCQSKYNFSNWIWSCFLLIAQIADLLLWNQAVVFSSVFALGNEFQQNVLDYKKRKCFIPEWTFFFLSLWCLNMSKDSLSSLSSIRMCFLSGGQEVYSRLCACAPGRMCPLHSVISFCKMLTLSPLRWMLLRVASDLETLMQNKESAHTRWFV